MTRLTNLGPRKARITHQQVEDALRKAHGYISRAAQLLGVDQRTVRRYISQSEQCQRALVEARDSKIDSAELQLEAAVSRCEPWAVSLTLRTIGKDRGYTERQELEHSGSIQIVISPTDAKL